MYLTRNENDSSWQAGEVARKVSQNLECAGSILKIHSKILREFQKFSRGSFVNRQSLVAHNVFSPWGCKALINHI